jgi:hypothetical protein
VSTIIMIPRLKLRVFGQRIPVLTSVDLNDIMMAPTDGGLLSPYTAENVHQGISTECDHLHLMVPVITSMMIGDCSWRCLMLLSVSC